MSQEIVECFSISKVDRDKSSCIKLTCADRFYLAEENRKQCIALQFNHLLDPVLLTEALYQAIEEYPTVGSRVIVQLEEEYFQIHAEDVKIFQVSVDPAIIRDVNEWTPAFQRFSQQVFADYKPLFQAYLLRSSQEPCGCILMVGFEHCLGDGASYAMFTECWSKHYSKLAPEPIPSDTYEILVDSLTASLHQGPIPLGPFRYTFSPETIAKLKADAAQARAADRDCAADAAWQPSANDVLLAHVACALAPLRRASCGAAEEKARVLVLADCRGRTWSEDRFGNAVRQS